MTRRTSVRTLPRPKRAMPQGTVRQLGDGQWEIRIARELKSANKTLWGHWRIKQREREAWEWSLVAAVQTFAGIQSTAGFELLKRSLSLFVPSGPKVPKVRSRIEIVRLVPHRRRFVQDDVNLRFASKHLVDAMKNIGMISADSRAWLDEPPPTQDLSADGEFCTVITLTRLPPLERPTRSRTKSNAPAVAGGLV